MTSPRRRSVYLERLQEFPEFVFADGGQFSYRGRWADHFRERIDGAFDGRIIVEIGCNDAALLATAAAKHPQTAFVGIDWKARALHTAAGRIVEAKLRNVALLHGRAQDIRQTFRDREINEIWLFHPDPCDKPRELPNRLFAEPFLVDAAAVLRDEGSRLILKTDHRDYYESSLVVIDRPTVKERFQVAAVSSDYWNDLAARAHSQSRAFAGEETVFEQRFRKKRKPIYYLELAPK